MPSYRQASCSILSCSRNGESFVNWRVRGRSVLCRLPLEKKSFRAYSSILYCNPRMKIYIQGCRVISRRLQQCLYKPRYCAWSSPVCFHLSCDPWCDVTGSISLPRSDSKLDQSKMPLEQNSRQSWVTFCWYFYCWVSTKWPVSASTAEEKARELEEAARYVHLFGTYTPLPVAHMVVIYCLCILISLLVIFSSNLCDQVVLYKLP